MAKSMAKMQTTRDSYPSQVITQLKAARELAQIKEARQDESGRRMIISERPEIRANHQAASQLIEYAAIKNGLETSKFEEIRERNQAELLRIADEQKHAAITQSSSVLTTFNRAIESKRRDFDAVIAAVEEPQPTQVVLDSPFLIWPTQGIELLDSQISPYHTMAKITLDSGDSYGSESLGFYFIWENPSDRYAVINVDSWLFFNGQLRASQNGGLFPGDRYADINVQGWLHVFEWWNHPPTEAVGQPTQAQSMGSADVGGGGFGDVGAIATTNIFRTIDLQRPHFLMPPHAVTVIEVSPTFNFRTGSDSGHVSADFNSGDFRFICPFVVIGILT